MANAAAITRRRRTGESGVAAIEFAIVFPVLLLLVFGMINLTHFIAAKRTVQSAAELVADLVTRQQTTIPATLIDDDFKAVELTFRPMELSRVQSDVGIDLYAYRLVGAEAQVIWNKFYRGHPRCTAPTVDMHNPGDPIGSLIAGSDVVVAVVCLTYTAPAANYPGLRFLANRRVEKQFIMRPRQTTILNCTPTGCP